MPPSPATRRSDRRAGAVVVGAFALLCIVFTGQFPPFGNPNEVSRFETVYAIVEDGTFRIDRALTVLGNHEDKATSGGHFYSNKAPGLALAAVPVYRLLRVVFPRPKTPFDPIFFWLRVLTVSSVCVIALARFQARLDGDGLPAAALVTAAVGFGTPYLFYARSFFSHAWTAALLLLSWDLLRVCDDWRFRRRVGVLLIGAGFLAGWAAISEYPVALVAMLLAVRAAARGAWRRGVLFAAGLAIPVAVLLAYDAICFGSPFVLSSAREAAPDYAALSHTGLFGVGIPSVSTAAATLFHPARGAFLYSPFLLWSAAGLLLWRRGKEAGADARLCLRASALFFVVMSGYSNWHGGWALGDRYLLPLLFFPALATPRALAGSLSRLLFAAAAAFSIASHLLMTASFPHFPLSVGWSPLTAAAWFIRRGWTAPAILPGPVALAAALLLTLVSLVGAAGAMRLRWPRVVAPIAGAAAVAALVALSPPASFGSRLWRAAVFDKFSGRDPAGGELRAVAASARSEAERRWARDVWSRYGPVGESP